MSETWFREVTCQNAGIIPRCRLPGSETTPVTEYGDIQTPFVLSFAPLLANMVYWVLFEARYGLSI